MLKYNHNPNFTTELPQAILDSMTSQIAIIDHDGTIIAVNKSWRDCYKDNNLTTDHSITNTYVGVNYLNVCQASFGDFSDGAAEAMTGIKMVLEGKVPSFSLEYPCHSPTVKRWFMLSSTPIGTERLGAVIVHRDITERKLVEKEQRLAAISFETREGIMITDEQGIIIKVNQAFSALTGYSQAEVLGKNPSMLSSGRHDETFYKKIWACLKETHYWQGEIWNRHKNGQIYPEWLTISKVTMPDDLGSHYIGTFSDITQENLTAARIHRMAYYDVLTNLPNRRLMEDRLNQALISFKRHGVFGAVLFMDLDKFKTVNDTRGHDVGDLLLIECGLRFLSSVREVDTVARLGGDEFVIILTDLSTSKDQALIAARQIAQKLDTAMNKPFLINQMQSNHSVSIGIAVFDQDIAVADLLKQADLALYQAKHAKYPENINPLPSIPEPSPAPYALT
jgi:diguanylate cyclase (GGDEF)-like protein/PAS domain S-box-containing protein